MLSGKQKPNLTKYELTYSRIWTDYGPPINDALKLIHPEDISSTI